MKGGGGGVAKGSSLQMPIGAAAAGLTNTLQSLQPTPSPLLGASACASVQLLLCNATWHVLDFVCVMRHAPLLAL